MSNVQLQSWLNDPTDFEMGIRLLVKFCPGKHTSFKTNARKLGSNAFFKKKLFTLLNVVNDSFIESTDPPLQTPQKRKRLEFTRQDFPKEQQLLWDERLSLFKQAAYWHSRVLLLSPKQQAAAITHIIENQIKINFLWEQLDYFFINKKPMAVQKEITQTEYFAALRRLNTLRTYKSKYKDEPHKWVKFEIEYRNVSLIVADAQNQY